MEEKEKQLSGKDNKRLEDSTPVNCEYTAAWANIDNILPHSQVTQPYIEDVIEAKDWVDNGSKL